MAWPLFQLTPPAVKAIRREEEQAEQLDSEALGHIKGALTALDSLTSSVARLPSTGLPIENPQFIIMTFSRRINADLTGTRREIPPLISRFSSDRARFEIDYKSYLFKLQQYSQARNIVVRTAALCIQPGNTKESIQDDINLMVKHLNTMKEFEGVMIRDEQKIARRREEYEKKLPPPKKR